MSVNTKMTAIADEIRELNGITETMNLDAMATNIGNANSEVATQEGLLIEIANLLSGKAMPDDDSNNIILQEKTVTPSTASQVVQPDDGYDGLSTVTVEAMPTATQATPSISVSSSGLITASATQTAGYVSAGTKSATKQLTTQGAQTITPGTADQTIAADKYLTGVQTIKGDANLVPENIISGKSIFGILGSATVGEGSAGGETSEICPSLTISWDAMYIDTIAYSTNGEYTCQNEPSNGVTLTNIDNNCPIFMCVWGDLGGNTQIASSENVEILLGVGNMGAFIFKCTSTNAATLALYDSGALG